MQSWINLLSWGVGGNKVFDRGATSGRGGSHEIFSFFEDFDLLRNLGHLVIMIDGKSYCLERLDREEPTFGIISFINRCKLVWNRMPMTFSDLFRLSNQFPGMGKPLSRMRRN